MGFKRHTSYIRITAKSPGPAYRGAVVKLDYYPDLLLKSEREVIRYKFLTKSKEKGEITLSKLKQLFKEGSVELMEPTPAMRLLYEK